MVLRSTMVLYYHGTTMVLQGPVPWYELNRQTLIRKTPRKILVLESYAVHGTVSSYRALDRARRFAVISDILLGSIFSPPTI